MRNVSVFSLLGDCNTVFTIFLLAKLPFVFLTATSDSFYNQILITLDCASQHIFHLENFDARHFRSLRLLSEPRLSKKDCHEGVVLLDMKINLRVEGETRVLVVDPSRTLGCPYAMHASHVPPSTQVVVCFGLRRGQLAVENLHLAEESVDFVQI